MRKKMKLIVTIDTEEDNWAHYSATNNPVSNIERIFSNKVTVTGGDCHFIEKVEDTC